MKPRYMPGIPLRWVRRPDGTIVLQQAWIKHEYSVCDRAWQSVNEYFWEDVPITEPNEVMEWSKECDTNPK